MITVNLVAQQFRNRELRSMKISNPNHAAMLQQVGLFQLNDYSVSEFAGYASASYVNSATEARDEVHRMYERILLHKASGLRIAYLIEESYYGDSAEYLVIDCFVITHAQQKLSVQAIDLQKQLFESVTGSLPFATVRNTVQEGD
jgi:hypothetical protein